jgi:hypothetical protein
MKRTLFDWTALADRGTFIAGIEYFLTDRGQIFQHFQHWGEERSLPVYFWNPGCSSIQQLGNREAENTVSTVFQPTTLAERDCDIIQYLLDTQQPGIFLLEGVLQFDERGQLSDRLTYQLSNAYQQLSWGKICQYWVLLSEQIELPPSLQPFIPVLVNALPNLQQIAQIVEQFCQSHHNLQTDADARTRLTRACQGLSAGEIDLVLVQSLPFAQSVGQLAQMVLSYKLAKLSGRGLDFIADPDVPTAAGLDLLDARLDLISALFNPEAQKQYGLKFPRGLILWGPPGTGKSLSAKLAAKKMGVPLMAVDWASISSDRELRFLLATAEAMAPVVLYFDDFDKGFAGWDSNADGGLSKRRAGKLLTWMQEHQSQVFVIATVNRLGMLPLELQRRVDDIYFVDLPHDGARYDIFNLHLAKYFPAFREAQKMGISPWTDDQWHVLLTEYRLCTPAEIGNAVRRVAEEKYFQLDRAGRLGDPLEITFEEMKQQRWHFTPAMIREENQMLEIRNNATFAKPVAGPDRSKFARPRKELFQSDEEEPAQLTAT